MNEISQADEIEKGTQNKTGVIEKIIIKEEINKKRRQTEDLDT